MNYDECVAWLNRYRDARRVELRLRERLREENHGAAIAGTAP